MKRKIMSLFLAVVIAFSAMLSPTSVKAAEDKDTSAPSVETETLKVSKKYVISGDTVKISVGISDFSDVEEVYLFYEMPVSKSVVYLPLIRHKNTGKFTIEFSIDNYTECGEWKAVCIVATDSEGNEIVVGGVDVSDVVADLSAADFYVHSIFPEDEEPHDFKLFTNQVLPLELYTYGYIEWSVSDESIAKLTDITFDDETEGNGTLSTCTVVPLKKGIVDVYAKDKDGNIYAATRILITAPEEYYDVHFYSSGGYIDVDHFKVKCGDYIKLPYVYDREGYSFLGWSRNPNAVVSEFAYNYEFVPTSDTKLYAVWDKNITYTRPEFCEVKLDFNDGVTDTETQMLEYFDQIKFPTPERDGYVCVGWSNDKYDLIAEKDCGDIYTVTDDVTFYAVWVREYSEEECDYVLELHETAKIEIDLPFKSYFIITNPNVASVNWNVEFIREGFGFTSNGFAEVVPQQLGVTEVIVYDENGYIVEIYKIFVKESTKYYTIKFDANGGEVNPDSIQVRHGESFIMPTATKEGYVLKGWSLKKNYNRPSYYEGYKVDPKSDLTFYAIWEVAPPPEVFDTTLGDVNSDNKINSTDALMILQHAVGKSLLSGTSLTFADVNKDSKVNSTDALKILQFSVGKIPSM